MIGEALGNIVGGILGKNASKHSQKQQKKMMKEAMAAYEKLGYAPDLSRELIVEELVNQGIFTPELEQALDIAQSEFTQIEPSRELTEAQLASIEGIKTLSKTGLGAEDRAAFNEIRNRLRQDENAAREALLQKLNAQGMGGSGAALIAQLGNSQQAANLASAEADKLMSQVSSARRDALQRLGTQAGEMANTKFNQDAEIARALDERNRFADQNSIARQRANVQLINNSNMFNRNEKQRLFEQNIQNRRAELERQIEEKGRQYDRNLNYAAGLSGQATKVGDFYGAQANRKYNEQVAMGKGFGGLVDAGVGAIYGTPAKSSGTSGWGSIFSDENKKTDITYNDAEVQSFMDRISKKYLKD